MLSALKARALSRAALSPLVSIIMSAKQTTLSFGRRPVDHPAPAPTVAAATALVTDPVKASQDSDEIPLADLKSKKRARADGGGPPQGAGSVASDDEIDDLGGGCSGRVKSSSKEATVGSHTIVGITSDYHPVRAAEWCPTGVPGSSRVTYAALVKVWVVLCGPLRHTRVTLDPLVHTGSLKSRVLPSA
jgi:hypothetical protein